MKKIILVLVVFSFFTAAKAQLLLDSLQLDTVRTYHSVESALRAKDLSKVYKLVLRKEHLKTLSKDIIKLKNLQYLDLSKNKFKIAPEQICQLKNLQYLNLADNKNLDSLPFNIGNLTHLKWLVLNRTKISTFPVSAGNLAALEYIDLWGTPVTTFPKSLQKLTNLKQVDLRVILYSDSKKTEIKSKFPPKTNILFTAGCGCGF